MTDELLVTVGIIVVILGVILSIPVGLKYGFGLHYFFYNPLSIIVGVLGIVVGVKY